MLNIENTNEIGYTERAFSDEKIYKLLYNASGQGKLQTVKDLLENHQILDQTKFDCIVEAALVGHVEMVELLIKDFNITQELIDEVENNMNNFYIKHNELKQNNEIIRRISKILDILTEN